MFLEDFFDLIPELLVVELCGRRLGRMVEAAPRQAKGLSDASDAVPCFLIN